MALELSRQEHCGWGSRLLYQGRGCLLREVRGCGSMNRICPVFLHGRGPAPARGRRVHAHVLRDLWLTSAASRKRVTDVELVSGSLCHCAGVELGSMGLGIGSCSSSGHGDHCKKPLMAPSGYTQSRIFCGCYFELTDTVLPVLFYQPIPRAGFQLP